MKKKNTHKEKTVHEQKRRFEFKLSAPEAKEVCLAGNFNKWSEISDPMKKDTTGTWKKTKMLPRGKYEYKFIVDGKWTLDPRCPNTAPNQYGTENNAIEI